MRTREMPFAALMLPFLMGVALPGFLHGQEAPPATPAAPEPAPAPRPVQSSQVVSGDLTIEAGQRVEEVVVIGGDLRVRGEVLGNAAVFGGNLILEEGGSVMGDAIVTGGQLLDEGGRVRGEMRSIDGTGEDIARQIQAALAGVGVEGATITEQVRREIARDVERDVRRAMRDDDGGGFLPRPIREGFGGLISALALGLVLAGIGAGLVFYGRAHLETVSDTVRGATLRAGLTGVAASFLVIPAFVVLIVALAVSIVGIPLLLVAIPVYPLAIFAAALFGMLAVTHAIGERTAEQSRHPFDMRYRNSYAYLFTGIAMLIAPLVAASLMHMTGFLGFIGTLLHIVMGAVLWVCATIGFGAVILSRAGTRRTFVQTPPEVSFDSDDFFGEEPVRSQGNA